MNNNFIKIKKLIDEADAILIGAGAGLSTSAGFIYDGKIFMDNFKYMYDQYGYTDMYAACFHPFATSEEKWGYWSKFITINRYQGAKQLYIDLFNLFKDKNYFILTTNVDHQFQLAGFDKKRIFYTQGDYGLFQCSEPCHQQTYDNEIAIRKMVDSLDQYHRIPSDLIPHCPRCGKQMSMNLRSDDTFVEDDGWREHKNYYIDFLEENNDKKVLLIELGVGFNTPGIIKYPFWQYLNNHPNAYLISINRGQSYVPSEIADRTLLIDEDIKEVFCDDH